MASKMRVVIPAVGRMLHPDVVPALTACGYAPEIRLLDDSPGHEDDYSKLLHEIFSDRSGPLMIVEHDVVVNRLILEGLEACQGLWCSNSYATGGETLLGCTRFRLDKLPPIDVPVGPWISCDGAVWEQVHSRGFRRHSHRPPPTHHHGWAYDK